VHFSYYLIPAAFLAGSIPTGLLIGRAKGIDIRQHGSKNIGATNVGRVLGKKFFFLCFAIDFLKGCLPPLLCGYLLGTLGHIDIAPKDAALWLASMIAPILGNVFNPWLMFKGGKGVATAVGALLAVAPPLAIPGLVGFIAWLLALKRWGYISLASITSAIAVPSATLAFFIAAHLDGRLSSFLNALPFIATTFILGALVIWTHRANIARLRAGTEPKAGHRST
jgi:acyl phosphate:glycerol-3-phosphate acyltransferase